MQGYIIAVLGVVIISVLVEIILPNGQTSKYIKSILAVFVVYVLVNPVITFLKTDFDLDKYVNSGKVELNQSLLENIYNNQIEAKELELENLLYNNGYEGVKVTLLYEIVEDSIKISKAKINIKNLVITSGVENINKYQYIRQVVISELMIKEEDVIFE